jgi:hypothetical protein
MSTQATQSKAEGEYTAEGKAMHLWTGGGKICCKRCTASSTRTKMQCGRPALRASRTQKCQFHGGRPHRAEVLQRIAEANILHGEATKSAKQQYRDDSAFIHELEDAMRVLKMGEGPRIRGRKPIGYKPVLSQADVVRMIQERLLHSV